MERAPRAPDRAHLPLLPSDPGGVGRVIATRGTVAQCTPPPPYPGNDRGSLLAEAPVRPPPPERVIFRAEDSPRGLWRSLGKRVGLTALTSSNLVSSATSRGRMRPNRGHVLVPRAIEVLDQHGHGDHCAPGPPRPAAPSSRCAWRRAAQRPVRPPPSATAALVIVERAPWSVPFGVTWGGVNQ